MYSHIGWMVMKQNPKRIGRVDIRYDGKFFIVVSANLREK